MVRFEGRTPSPLKHPKFTKSKSNVPQLDSLLIAAVLHGRLSCVRPTSEGTEGTRWGSCCALRELGHDLRATSTVSQSEPVPPSLASVLEMHLPPSPQP